MADKPNKGWIKVYRDIRDHWIWSCERHSKQSAWFDLLMMVNHEDHTIMVGNKRIVVHRGQVWTSYKKLKDSWQWSNDRLYGFIDQLVEDHMIAVNPTNTGTLITVLNYKKYQGSSDVDAVAPERGSERKSERGSERTPEFKSETNKNDRRMKKNVKKGEAPRAGDFEP